MGSRKLGVDHGPQGQDGSGLAGPQTVAATRLSRSLAEPGEHGRSLGEADRNRSLGGEAQLHQLIRFQHIGRTGQRQSVQLAQQGQIAQTRGRQVTLAGLPTQARFQNKQ